MNVIEKLSIVTALIVISVIVGFFIGRQTEKTTALTNANHAYQTSREVENEVNTLNLYSRCLAVGGLPDECKILMRGLDKTAKGQ